MNKTAILEALPLAAVSLKHRQVSDEDRPQTPEALHAWLLEVTGNYIPATSVCPDHCAPFDFVRDFFFHDETDALVLANRGGGKTSNLAALHLANGRWKPPFETSHIGAIDIQAHRCYAYYRQGLRYPSLASLAPDPHIRSTEWTNGSWIEILPGTERQTQGGHPHLVAYDELESGKYQPYENAKGMPAEWVVDGIEKLGQFLAASTRVTSMGLMQRALDEAAEKGTRVYEYCIFETMQPCTEECETNGCLLYEWTQGRSRQATGWRSHQDILSHYRRAGQDTWEAQYLCRKPEAKALIYAPFSGANVTEEADYVEGGGPLFMFYDWGFTDPTHIDLVQYRDGAFYQFDEMVGSNRSEREWVRETVRRITQLPDYDGPTFEPEPEPEVKPLGWVKPPAWTEIWKGRQDWPSPWPEVWPEAVGDPSAVQFRAELKEQGVGAASPKQVKHNVEEGQDVLRAAFCSADGERRYFIHPRCVKSIEAVSRYRARQLSDGSFDPRPDPDPANHAFSHGCDSKRYGIWRLRRWLGLGQKEEE